VDGRYSYFEWVNSGHYHPGGERGSMARVTQGIVKELYFGFNATQLLIRVDTVSRASKALLDHAVDRMQLSFPIPPGIRVTATGLTSANPSVQIAREDQALDATGSELAVGRIVELAIPQASLGLEADQPVSFSLELFSNDVSVDRLPREGTIDLVVPSKNFERIMWHV
jgi:hypothetical protein